MIMNHMGLLTAIVICRRAHIPDATANISPMSMLQNESGIAKQQLRPPIAVLVQNVHNINNSIVVTTKEGLIDGKYFFKLHLEKSPLVNFLLLNFECFLDF